MNDYKIYRVRVYDERPDLPTGFPLKSMFVPMSDGTHLFSFRKFWNWVGRRELKVGSVVTVHDGTSAYTGKVVTVAPGLVMLQFDDEATEPKGTEIRQRAKEMLASCEVSKISAEALRKLFGRF